MSELGRSLAELRRLGLPLDPTEAAAAAAERRARLNTSVYPVMRALGYHLLLFGVVVHNRAVFGELHWPTLLLYLAVVEAYVVLSWLALRHWFLRFPAIAGWDLADLLFAADLVLWAGAIHVTGGPQSLLWLLPLLRVADHHPVRRVWVFAHLAPLTYTGVVAWAVLVDGQAVNWGVEATKAFVLYGAGLYIAVAAGPTQRYRTQRAAALAAATALLGDLADRTRRIDEANRSRGLLLGRLGGELRQALVRMAGFSRFLLRDEGSTLPPGPRTYVERIRDDARAGLRLVDEAMLPAGPPPNHPKVSLTGLLQQAAVQEAQEAEDWREAARLELPAGDAVIHADGRAMTRVLRHLLGAARQFGGGAPEVELRVDPGTGTAESIVIRCAQDNGAAMASHDLANPFRGARAGDQDELAARLELDLAQAISRGLGYRIETAMEADRQMFTLRLR